MARIFINLILFLILTSPSWAANWYVRDGGGSVYGASQATNTCNGHTNVVYSFGASPNCALNHPSQVMGGGYGGLQYGSANQRWAGGDTLSIDGDSDTTFDFTVSGITTAPAVGDTYTNNSDTWTVTFVNVNSGAGIISASSALGNTPTSSGTLTRAAGSGDSTISFSAKTGSQAQYAIGFGMPNTTQCASIYGYQCFLNSAPAGISAQQPTSIIGTGTHRPMLYGSTSTYQILTLQNNYLSVSWLEITDKGSCGAISSACTGANSAYGIVASGTGLTFTDIYVHSMNTVGVATGQTGSMTFTRLWSIGNGRGGVYIGNDGNETVTGTLTFNQPIIEWNGCAEDYPMTQPGIDNPNNYHQCVGQSYGNYANGDGLAFEATGGEYAGNWNVYGPGSISFNTQDGFDILHGIGGTGTDNVDKIRFEGNAGDALKLTGQTTNLTNSVIIGDCGWWYQSAQVPSGQMPPGDTCRANGDVIVFWEGVNSVTNIINNTIMSNGNIVLGPDNGDGSGCTGAAINFYNNIVYGGYAWGNSTFINPAGDNSLTTYIYPENGSCGITAFNEDYNIVINTKGNNTNCSGTHDKCGNSPGFVSSLPMGTAGGALNTYYQGWSGVTYAPITTSSAAKQAGNTGYSYWKNSNDYYDVVRGTGSPEPSIGGLEYNSMAAAGYLCFFNSDCIGGSCTNNFCGGSCSANGTTCADNLTCCSPICSTTCQGCIGSGTADGGSSSNCCSGLQSGGTCVNYICGDGNMPETGKTCDTTGPNLNGQTCSTQGFIGGTLGCLSGCLGFDTSGCNNTCLTTAATCTSNGQCCSTVCNAGQCANQTGDITTGLVGWWKFDEGSGSTVTDSSGNSNNGTSINSPTYVTGKIGTYALSFNGTTQEVSSFPSDPIASGASMSVCAWINPSSTSKGSIAADRDTNNVGWQLDSNRTSAGNLTFINGGVLEASAGITQGSWQHVCATWSSSGNIATLYLNGVSVGNGSVISSGTRSGNSFLIANTDSSTPAVYAGSIDDLRIYNRALSSIDVTALYQYTSSCTTNGNSCSSSGQCCSALCSGGTCTSGQSVATTGNIFNGTFRGTFN